MANHNPPARLWHRRLGLLLLLPLCLWALTGLVFYFKPGYGGAYEQIAVKAYPLPSLAAVSVQPTWLEVRRLHTVLGEHLLVRTAAGWQQLHPHSLEPRSLPTAEVLRPLFEEGHCR